MSSFTRELIQLQPDIIGSTIDLDPNNQVVHRHNCLYIVSAILIEADKILLVSEAKSDCYGLLYLPAGKVKKKETLQNAFKRELTEESFVEGEIDHLVSCDCQFGWFRFNFLGHKTGGRLKEKSDADKESLEANWYLIDDLLSRKLELRCEDIIAVVQDAVNWLCNTKNIQHEKSVPIAASHTHHLQRLIVIDHRQEKHLKVLIDKLTNSFPINELAFPIESQVHKCLKETELSVKFLGVLSVEHLPTIDVSGQVIFGNLTDGLCFNLLCEVVNGELSNIDQLIWISADLEEQLKTIKSSGSFIKMNLV